MHRIAIVFIVTAGVRIAAAKALAAKGAPLDPIIELSLRHDGMHQKDVVAICKKAGAVQAAEAFLDIINDEASKRVWLVAIEALGALLVDCADEITLAAA